MTANSENLTSLALSSLLQQYPYPHPLILTKNPDEPIKRGQLSGSFPTGEGAVDVLLQNEWLNIHSDRGDTLVFTFESENGVSEFKGSLGRFEDKGYRVVGESELSSYLQ